METSTFGSLVQWILTHGYFLFFLATFFEGPVVTSAAGVAASFGYFSLPLVILISIAGDVSADVVCYALGYYGGSRFADRYGKSIGLTRERIEKIKRLLLNHTGKAMIVIKLSPLIPVPGLITVGMMRVPFIRFIQVSLLITIPKLVVFALIGFFAGRAYEKFSGAISMGQYILFAVVPLIAILVFAYQRITASISHKNGLG